jgi:hypothetical protein
MFFLGIAIAVLVLAAVSIIANEKGWKWSEALQNSNVGLVLYWTPCAAIFLGILALYGVVAIAILVAFPIGLKVLDLLPLGPATDWLASQKPA